MVRQRGTQTKCAHVCHLQEKDGLSIFLTWALAIRMYMEQGACCWTGLYFDVCGSDFSLLGQWMHLCAADSFANHEY